MRPMTSPEADHPPVFEDDDDDDDEATEADDSEDDDEGSGAPTPAAEPPPGGKTPNAATLQNPIEPSSSSSDRAPKAGPCPNLPSDHPSGPQNGGVVPALPLSAVAPAPGAGRALVVSSAKDAAAAAASYEESRRLFQRLWTDEEEILILRGFLDFTTRRGTTFASHQYDTGPFYEEIRRQFPFDCSKNQLIEKLRRLKKKYRTCVARIRNQGKDFAFRSPHEQAIFEIARNIWRPGIKRDRSSDGDKDTDGLKPPIPADSVSNDGADRKMVRSRRRLRRRITEAPAAELAATGAAMSVPVTAAAENSLPIPTPPSTAAMVPKAVEETLRSCLTPLLKELIISVIEGPPGGGGGWLGLGGSLSPPRLSLGGDPSNRLGAARDERWRRQQILELEVYLKRIELVRDQVRSALEQLMSSGS